MKILLVHNYYQSASPSGEDIVFKNEYDLLVKKGMQVISYVKHNDEIIKYGLWKNVKAPFNNIWSRQTYRDIKRLIKKEKPDICHFHNISYLISPSAYYACKSSGIPVVQTLHNYRIFCSTGLLYRESEICEECLGKSPVKGLMHGCFRNSRVYTLPVTLMEYIHHSLGTWREKVDGFIALTEFAMKKFINAGLPEKKIFIKPNFLVSPPRPKFSPGGYALFAGRLSPEKGIFTLLNAWKRLSNVPLKVVGDGPLKKEAEQFVEKHNLFNVDIVGMVSRDTVVEFMRNAMFVVFPSEWYEGFPMTLVEAYACGKPVIASRTGAMREIVRDGGTGLLFELKNPGDLVEKVNSIAGNTDECERMGKKAREEFEEYYTPGRNIKILMDIYQRVLS